MEVPNISDKTHYFEISPTLADLCHMYSYSLLIFPIDQNSLEGYLHLSGHISVEKE